MIVISILKNSFWHFPFILALLLCMGWWLYFPSPVNFLAVADKTEIIYEPMEWCDKKDDPHVQFIAQGSGLHYSYRLVDAHQATEEVVLPTKDKSFFDLSRYDQVEFTFRMKEGKRLSVSLFVEETIGKEHSPPQIVQRPLTYILDASPDFHTQVVPIAAFQTSRHWYTAHRLSEQEIQAPDWSRMRGVGFSTDKYYLKNNHSRRLDVVDIERVRFTRNAFPLYLASAVLGCIQMILWLAFFITSRKMKKKRELLISYTQLDLKNKGELEWEMISNYVSLHYQEQELSLKRMQLSTGLHERKISALIKEKTKLSFKQYVNGYRLDKAKELLLDESLPISEVAFLAGYGNITHFNKVFKADQNMNPKEYRKQYGENDLQV